MSDKDYRKAINDLINQYSFDKMLQEIDISKIEAKYIEKIVLYYTDGSTVDVYGYLLSGLIDINEIHISPHTTDEAEVYECRLFINTNKLERDINKLIDDSFNQGV